MSSAVGPCPAEPSSANSPSPRDLFRHRNNLRWSIICVTALGIAFAGSSFLPRPRNAYPEFAKLGVPRQLEEGWDFYRLEPICGDAPDKWQEYKNRCQSWEIRAPYADTDAALKRYFRKHPDWRVRRSGTATTYAESNGQTIQIVKKTQNYESSKSYDSLILRTTITNGHISRRTLTVYHPSHEQIHGRIVADWLRLDFHG
jgi:hypothetical protein